MMKRKAIALLLAAGLAAGMVGAAAVPADDEFLWESFSGEEIPDEELYYEDPDEEMTDPVLEDGFFTENEEDEDVFEPVFEDGEDDTEPEETYVYTEESEAEEAALAGSEPVSGSCGENAVWTVTGPDDNLKMTISGSGEIAASNSWNDYKASVKSVEIEPGLTAIGWRAFGGFSGMKEITIPDSVGTINSNAFENCSSLEEISIPSGVTEIKISTFSGCSGLVSVDLSECLSIGTFAFEKCSSLTSITLPDSLQTLGGTAFCGCSSLTEIVIPEKVKTIESSAFRDCTGLTTVSLPSELDSIGYYAFYNCASLTDINIPDTLTRINDYAFGGCNSLTEILVPDSVTYIASHAFDSCEATLLVYFGSYAESFAKDAGLNYKSICKMHVWEESYTVDKEATYTEGGSESIHCEICGEIKPGSEREIPKLKKPVSMLEISGIEDKTYTGEAQKQALVVKDGDTVLIEGPDYTVSYIDNTKAGKATVIITGEGEDYTDEVKKTFMINPMSLADAELNGVQNYVWTGSPIEPKPVVILNGKTLEEDKDYYLTYRTNKNTGRAGVTANGKGNYTDSAVRHFAIKPKPSWIASLSSPKTKQIAVKWGNRAQISGFQLVLSVKPDCSSPKITKNIYDPKLLSMTVPVYNAKKTYYVRIRTFKKTYDKTYFSEWSAIKTVKTK